MEEFASSHFIITSIQIQIDALKKTWTREFAFRDEEKCLKKNIFFGFRQLKVSATALMAEVTLPDPAAGRKGRQLGVCWGPGNFLLLHVKKSKAEQQRLGGGSGEESKVHEVRWETTLYEPVFRKLVKKSLGIFLSLQKLAEAGVVSDQLVRRTILKNMKSQMHSCDNWSTGESVSTVQERDKRLPRTAGTSR